MLEYLPERSLKMHLSDVKFSNLTNAQIKEIQTLESKINSSNNGGQETILIAYASPDQS